MARADDRQASPAHQSRHSGPVSARIDVQDHRRHRGARRRRDQPVHAHPLSRRAAVRQPLLPLLEEGWPRLGQPARGVGAVVRRVLLSGGAAPRHRRHRPVRARLRARDAHGHRSRAREGRDHPGHGVEAEALQAAVVCGRDAVGRHRPRVRDRDAAADGQRHRDGGGRQTLPPTLRPPGRDAGRRGDPRGATRS